MIKVKMENMRCSFVRTCYLTVVKVKWKTQDVHLLELVA